MTCRRALLVLLVAVIAAASSGCSSDPAQGYSTASLFPRDISSVAVPIFVNKTYTRDVEFELTDALVKEIEARTPYKVMSEASADTVFLGTIRSIELDQLSKSRTTGLSEEVVVSVTIDFQWKDLRNGKVLLERKTFAGHGLFVPSTPTGEPIELGQFAVVQLLAKDIVSEMRSDW